MTYDNGTVDSTFARANVARKIMADVRLAGKDVRVELVLDFSGSMRGYYSSGGAQCLLEAIWPMATALNADGRMHVTLFGDQTYQKPYVSWANVGDYVGTTLAHSPYSFDCDSYSYLEPALRVAARGAFSPYRGLCRLGRRLFCRPAGSSPALIIVAYDGSLHDLPAVMQMMSKAASMRLPIFFQFIYVPSCFPPAIERKLRSSSNAAHLAADHMADYASAVNMYRKILHPLASWVSATTACI